jgi:hypothetical protein
MSLRIRRSRSRWRFAPGRDLGSLYAKHFADPCQERRFLSTAGFLGAFAAARGITHSIRSGIGPFRNLSPGGHHIHHMTFGIAGLLATGYLWVNQVGVGLDPRQRRASRITSVLYGAGSALTLDEFALWLNLEDDYWTKKGRESIDAVTIYGALLVLGLNGRHLLAELAKSATLSPRARRRARMRRVARQRTREVRTLARDPQRLKQLLRP